MIMHGGHRIYNHDVSRFKSLKNTNNSALSSAIALGLTGKDDIIQLHPSLQTEFPYITKHYDKVGLEYTKNVIWDLSPEVLQDFPKYDLSTVMFDTDIHNLRPDTAWLNTVEFIDNKNNFIALAKKISLSTPDTSCFLSKKKFFEQKYLPLPGILKKAVSSSGDAIFRCKDMQDCLEILSAFDEDVPFQIQQEIHANTFLNLQYEISDNILTRLCVTEQLLKGYSRYGNRYPADQAPWEYVEPMAKWMYTQGMKGIFAFDIAIVNNGDKTLFFPIECNPRYNGSTYGTKIASKLSIPEWRIEIMSTVHRSLQTLKLDHLYFDTQKNSGIIIVHWGKISLGFLTILMAGSPEVQNELLIELEKELN